MKTKMTRMKMKKSRLITNFKAKGRCQILPSVMTPTSKVLKSSRIIRKKTRLRILQRIHQMPVYKCQSLSKLTMQITGMPNTQISRMIMRMVATRFVRLLMATIA